MVKASSAGGYSASTSVLSLEPAAVKGYSHQTYGTEKNISLFRERNRFGGSEAKMPAIIARRPAIVAPMSTRRPSEIPAVGDDRCRHTFAVILQTKTSTEEATMFTAFCVSDTTIGMRVFCIPIYQPVNP